MTLRIVHVVAHDFFSAEDGGRLKTATLATALAALGELHCVSLDDDHRPPGAARPVQARALPWGGTCAWHSLVHISCKQILPRSPAGWFRAVRAGLRLPLRWLPATARHGALMARIASLAPDLLVADETVLAAVTAFLPARWRVVHTHNMDSQAMAWSLPGDPTAARRLRVGRRLARIERTLFPRMDQVWAVRAEDLAAYAELGIPPGRLWLAPNVVPDACFEPAPGPGRPGRALFFGSLWYPPNQEALAWLLDHWPELRRRFPSAELVVAGRGAPAPLAEQAARTAGVELLGFVPDLKPLLAAAVVVVVPIEHGGGTKLKLVEALAAGRPVLATPAAAEGLALVDGVHARILPTGSDFLEALGELLQAPEAGREMGLRGQAHAREQGSMAALRAAVGRALASMGASPEVIP